MAVLPVVRSLRQAFERVDEHRRDIKTGLLHDFLETGRAGHVDLGQVAGDHVDTDEQQPASGEFRTDRIADLALARGEVGGMRAAPGGEVGADLAILRQAVDRAGRPAGLRHRSRRAAPIVE